MYKTRTIVLITLGFASLFFLAFGLSGFMFSSPFIPPDSHSYINASNLLFNELKPHPYRPLGFAFILGLPNLFLDTMSVKQYVIYGVLLNIAAWIGTLVFLFKTLCIYFNKKTAFWLTVFSLLSIGSMVQVFLVLTESVTGFFLAVIVFQILKYNKDKNFKRLVFSVALLNLLILIRPGFLYIGLLGSVVLIGYSIIKKIKWSSITTLFISSAALLALQFFMMHKTFSIATVSFIDKVTWYCYLGAEAQAATNEKDYMEVHDIRRAELAIKSYPEMMTLCSADMKHQVRHNFFNVIKEYGKNIAENSYGGAYVLTAIKEANKNESKVTVWFANLLYIISRLQNVFYIFLFIVSSVLLLKAKFNFSLYSIMAVVSYVILTSGISFWQGDRFHFILYPAILVVFVILIKDKPFGKKWLQRFGA